jgi:hypothetical protein
VHKFPSLLSRLCLSFCLFNEVVLLLRTLERGISVLFTKRLRWSSSMDERLPGRNETFEDKNKKNYFVHYNHDNGFLFYECIEKWSTKK